MRVVVAFPRAAWLTCAASIAACGGDAPGVRLVPVGDGPCGRPAGARSLLVTPLGEFPSQRRSIALGAPVAFADLPADTRQLAVEVLGDGAEVLAQGKTAPFVLTAFLYAAYTFSGSCPPRRMRQSSSSLMCATMRISRSSTP